MKDISGKIQGIANGFSFLIILGGVLTIINGKIMGIMLGLHMNMIF